MSRTFIQDGGLYVRTMSGKAILIALCGPSEKRAALLSTGMLLSMADAIALGYAVRVHTSDRPWNFREEAE